MPAAATRRQLSVYEPKWPHPAEHELHDGQRWQSEPQYERTREWGYDAASLPTARTANDAATAVSTTNDQCHAATAVSDPPTAGSTAVPHDADRSIPTAATATRATTSAATTTYVANAANGHDATAAAVPTAAPIPTIWPISAAAVATQCATATTGPTKNCA